MLRPVAPMRACAAGALPHCQFPAARAMGTPLGRAAAARFTRGIRPPQAHALELQGGGGTAVAEAARDLAGTLAQRLRLGKLEPDGLSYKESFVVRCYEVGVNKTATVETIANLLQEVGCNHAQSVGFSTDGFATTPTMRKLRLIWVTSRMHIEIYKYPAWGDVVEIETWCQGEGKIGTRRDWIIKDYATGDVIGRATSNWVMMNQDTRRLQRVSDEVREEYLVFCPRTLRKAFPEEDSGCLKKIPKLEDPAQYARSGLVSMPQEIIDTHELQTITLDYKRECQHDDAVDSLTSLESGDIDKIIELTSASTNGKPHDEDGCQFLHFLRLSSNGLEINRGRTQWRRLQK
ncbi:hypothetical protein Taro_033844 [Colocasia esculenta]|uniref:Acyl-[acyl-carrier-protein] hydrolase n=1 Tax=Colocasia esculenta TaxID=4460 RepID=A0A843W857_COLES|nr:hypothetical protein [Colocasia esculenta]